MQELTSSVVSIVNNFNLHREEAVKEIIKERQLEIDKKALLKLMSAYLDKYSYSFLLPIKHVVLGKKVKLMNYLGDGWFFYSELNKFFKEKQGVMIAVEDIAKELAEVEEVNINTSVVDVILSLLVKVEKNYQEISKKIDTAE